MGKYTFENYKNIPSFNGIPCKPGEVLAPLCVDSDMRVTLENLGLISSNIIPLHFPYTSRVIPTAFIAVMPEEEEFYVKYYYEKAHIFLNGEYEHLPEGVQLLSLDKMLDDIQNLEEYGKDPTGVPSFEDDLVEEINIWQLFIEMSEEDPRYEDILTALYYGYDKSTIWEAMLSEYSRSSAYENIAKIQKKAVSLYNQKYHG